MAERPGSPVNDMVRLLNQDNRKGRSLGLSPGLARGVGWVPDPSTTLTEFFQMQALSLPTFSHTCGSLGLRT